MSLAARVRVARASGAVFAAVQPLTLDDLDAYVAQTAHLGPAGRAVLVGLWAEAGSLATFWRVLDALWLDDPACKGGQQLGPGPSGDPAPLTQLAYDPTLGLVRRTDD